MGGNDSRDKQPERAPEKAPERKDVDKTFSEKPSTSDLKIIKKSYEYRDQEGGGKGDDD
jgi:major membrane immunogen (membrane-anchored lipoprotein)